MDVLVPKTGTRVKMGGVRQFVIRSRLSQNLVREVLIICYLLQICYSFLCKIQITKASLKILKMARPLFFFFLIFSLFYVPLILLA